ncbi:MULTISPECIES: hypothetical protein [Leuconostoc]|uniref:hypothetical protein n=1 Tax=Leuconostoc TaxID=1243 RepID=UPI001CC6494C|nr:MULTISPECIES: hypothetical protein [Leuconostoc]MBZ5971599.1 hypothetical protein [Leuconostoc gasicomitatum]MCM6827604.1 hypothetical protein [Leuconostoc mesenteroides]
MKFGIEIYERDQTPGYRDSNVWEEWFDSAEERNKKYEQYIESEKPSSSPEDIMIELEYPSYVTTTYKKIWKDD